VYFSVYWGTSGRGPTRLMFPASTLNNCGSSSAFDFLSHLPTGVILGSPSAVRKEFDPSLLAFMVRNLQIINGRPNWPVLTCRKKIGPRLVSFTASAAINSIGDRKISPLKAPATSRHRFPTRE